MSINDASRGMLPDIGEQKTDAKEPVRGELVVVSQGDHDTMRHQISRSPDEATVVERQHCSAPRCSSAVKRQRSPSPRLSILQSESYTVYEEGKPVKRAARGAGAHSERRWGTLNWGWEETYRLSIVGKGSADKLDKR